MKNLFLISIIFTLLLADKNVDYALLRCEETHNILVYIITTLITVVGILLQLLYLLIKENAENKAQVKLMDEIIVLRKDNEFRKEL